MTFGAPFDQRLALFLSLVFGIFPWFGYLIAGETKDKKIGRIKRAMGR